MKYRTFLILSTYFLLLYLSYSSKNPYSKRHPNKPKPTSCHRNVTYSSNPSEDLSIINQRCTSHLYCLDIKLPYKSIAVSDNLPDGNYLNSIEDVLEYLKKWENFRKLPKCWPTLQAGLCSIFMPQCDEDPATGRKSRVSMSNIDICNDIVNDPDCGPIGRLFGWPSLFNCSDTSLFARNCTNELRGLRNVSSSPTCPEPLVPSNNPETWFKDFNGCALHCKYPTWRPEDQVYLSAFIKLTSIVGLITTLFAIALFNANSAKGKSSNIDQIMTECNMFHCLNYLGWSLQIFVSDISCSPNGSTSYYLPATCILSFILTYLPSMYNLILCAYLGRLCYEKLDERNDKLQVDRRLIYGIPSAIFVAVICSAGIEANGLYGICTIAQHSLFIRSISVLITILGTIYGLIYFSITLVKFMPALKRPVEKKSSDVQRNEFYMNFIRIFALAICNTIYVIFTAANHAYAFMYQEKWEDSIDNYIACSWSPYWKLNDPEMSLLTECRIDTKPSILLYFLELLPALTSGMIIASWSYQKDNLISVLRKLIDLLKKFLILLDPFEQSKENGKVAESSCGTPSSLRRSTTIGSMDQSMRFPERMSLKMSDRTSRDVLNSCRYGETNSLNTNQIDGVNSSIINQSNNQQLSEYVSLVLNNFHQERPESSQESEFQFYHGLGQN